MSDATPPPPEAQPGTRSLEKEVEIEAPAEAVWDAVSRAEELVRWFPLEARVEPGEGGSIYLSWGEGVAGEARIDAWEPGRRLRWIEGEAVAVEVTIEGRGGRSVVRLVQSGFSASADWDEYYDAVDTGWTFFLRNLKHYLERHPGEPCEIVYARRPTGRSHEEAWAALTGPAGLDPGEPLASAPEEAAPGEDGEAAAAEGAVAAEDERVVPVSLGDARVALAPWLARPGKALAGSLPELEEASLLVELEPGAERWHCGFWLYTWGLFPERRAELREALETLAERVTGE